MALCPPADAMKIATWNVNSLRVRLAHLQEWLRVRDPDIVCLQETKVVDEDFPAEALAQSGYRSIFSGQKTYNGVAILLREERMGEAADVCTALPGLEDPQKRVLAITVDGLRVICAYFPNGQSVESEKFRYKLQWLAALQAWIGPQLAAHPRLALLGDFNIAPADADVCDPAAWRGQVLCTDEERAAFTALLGAGTRDAFRLFDQPERSFTWWDYRNLAFRRKQGLRIDHILLSTALAGGCTSCTVDVEMRRLEQPSDHAPVVAEFA
jgi:exodeoxyribonuclease-3